MFDLICQILWSWHHPEVNKQTNDCCFFVFGGVFFCASVTQMSWCIVGGCQAVFNVLLYYDSIVIVGEESWSSILSDFTPGCFFFFSLLLNYASFMHIILVNLKDKFTCQESYIFGQIVEISLWKYTKIRLHICKLWRWLCVWKCLCNFNMPKLSWFFSF